MNMHPEPEQLSAYIDGELADDERTPLEQHLTGCSTCAATVRGLRATVADLRALPAPAPSAQDSWALRAAVNRARRRPAARYRRWTVAAGSAAAVAIAIVATTMTVGGKTPSRTAGAPALASADRSSLVEVTAADYTRTTALSLLAVARGAPGTVTTTNPVEKGASSEAAPYAALSPAATYLPAIARCERQVLSAASGTRTPIRYVVATFEGTPAFFLVYQVRTGSEEKTELWVVQRSDCYIRFFVPPR
ncbi:MAG: anti-sigma factor family protein [Actinomycetota bacterium]